MSQSGTQNGCQNYEQSTIWPCPVALFAFGGRVLCVFLSPPTLPTSAWSHLLLSSVENGSHLCGGIVMAFCESVGWLSIRIRFGLLFVCVIIQQYVWEFSSAHWVKKWKKRKEKENLLLILVIITVFLDYRVSVLFNGPTLAMEEKIVGQGCA